MALECKVFRSVDAIGRDSINSLAEDGFFTYEWFKTLETQQSFRISPFYLAVFDEDKVIAVAPCFVELSYFFQYGPQVAVYHAFIAETTGSWPSERLLPK